MNYMIHSCNQRQWYVDEYLIPSMISQGINKDDIIVYQDKECKGNLFAFLDSIDLLPEKGHTWHLQDDVVISMFFKDYTELEEHKHHGIVCGFASKYCKDSLPGYTCGEKMWYSFPCIRIPNTLLREFKVWVQENVLNNPEYRMWVRKKKYDDSIFQIYVMDYWCGSIYNLEPNIVDHVDYLLGGSTLDTRKEQIRAEYFIDAGEVDALKKALERRKKYGSS